MFNNILTDLLNILNILIYNLQPYNSIIELPHFYFKNSINKIKISAISSVKQILFLQTIHFQSSKYSKLNHRTYLIYLS